jgi:hypothetical protein
MNTDDAVITDKDETPVGRAFDAWCFAAMDETVELDGRPMPLLTTLIYRVCGNDLQRFDEALRIVKAAYSAGFSAAREPVARTASDTASTESASQSSPTNTTT